MLEKFVHSDVPDLQENSDKENHKKYYNVHVQGIKVSERK